MLATSIVSKATDQGAPAKAPTVATPTIVKWEAYTIYLFEGKAEVMGPPTPRPQSRNPKGGGVSALPAVSFADNASTFGAYDQSWNSSFAKGQAALKSIEAQRAELAESSRLAAEAWSQDLKAKEAAKQSDVAKMQAHIDRANGDVMSAAIYLHVLTQNVQAAYEEKLDAVKRNSQNALSTTDEAIKQVGEGVSTQVSEMTANLDKVVVPLEEIKNGVPPIATASEIISVRLAPTDNALANELRLSHILLANTQPLVSWAQNTRTLGMIAAQEGYSSALEGDYATAEVFRSIAVAVTDIGLGFIPVAGVLRDGYEAITGVSLLTGDNLGYVGQGLAVAGVLTAGAASAIPKTVGALNKIGTVASHGSEQTASMARAIELGENLAVSARPIQRFGPLNAGPLSEIPLRIGGTVADTFHAGSYTVMEATAPTKIYRVWGGRAKEFAPYYSLEKPRGPLQATLDAALDPANGNLANRWLEVTIPVGTKFSVGKAAAISVDGGTIYGHGSQIYLPNVSPTWKTDGGTFE